MANRPYDATLEPRPGEQKQESELRYQRFLGDLQRAGLGSGPRAEQIAVLVLGMLEQRISATEAKDLNEELPWALRDLLRRFERHPRSRPEQFGREEMLARLGAALGIEAAECERVTRAVLQAARTLLSEKEASDVASQIPKDMQDLWVPPA
jgi:uncharacterized protein (DUF2267 family)